MCTYRRNEQLRTLLEALVVAASYASDGCDVAVVVVDDTTERLAEDVVTQFRDRFALGIHYMVSGERNISVSRNIGLETGIALGDWIASTDDDCVPNEHWIASLISVQARTGASAVSGRYVRRAPQGSPSWLTDQPILSEGIHLFEDASPMTIASTHNSMISAEWLRQHPEIRFDPRLGRLGGEDMVFFKTAHDNGLTIRYSFDAVVFEDQMADRCTYRYLVRNSLWLGNSQFVTSFESSDAGRVRLLGHGLHEAQRALIRPISRMLARQAPQIRFASLGAVRAAGLIAGVLGVRIKHH